LFHKNWLDATFRFYINGNYGTFYSNRLTSRSAPFVFLDIGANQGLYTLCAASNVHCAKAYAFEPVGPTYQLLQQNAAVNDLADKCELVKKAIGPEAQTAEIKLRPNHSGTASLMPHVGSEPGFVTETIEIVDGAAVASILGRDATMPIVCKIDVEGFEKSVLEALVASDTISAIEEIFYEVDEVRAGGQELEDMLRTVGFTQFERIGDMLHHYDVLATR
jgi:FkbM family methyltransferase